MIIKKYGYDHKLSIEASYQKGNTQNKLLEDNYTCYGYLAILCIKSKHNAKHINCSITQHS